MPKYTIALIVLAFFSGQIFTIIFLGLWDYLMKRFTGNLTSLLAALCVAILTLMVFCRWSST